MPNYFKSLWLGVIGRLSWHKISHRLRYGFQLWINKPDYSKPLGIQKNIRKLLFELIDLFESQDITYWIDHGTLLGCIRNEKLIPWDDDGDLSCLFEDKENVRQLLEKGNKQFRETKNHFKIFLKSGSYEHIDIFFYKELIPGILVMTYGYEQHIHKADIICMQKRKLYGRTVNVPNHPEQYLARKWGPTWRDRHDKYISGTEKYYYHSRKVMKRDFKESRLLAYSLHFEDNKYTMNRPMETPLQDMEGKNIIREGEEVLYSINGQYARQINKQIIWTSREMASRFILSEKNRLSIMKTGSNFWPTHTITVVMPAAGTGDRIQNHTPKQFLKANGKPVIYYALKPFVEMPQIHEIIIGVKEDRVQEMKGILDRFAFEKCHIVVGGDSRRETLHQCITFIKKTDFVILHDAVRPFVQKRDIELLIKQAPYYEMVTFCIPIRGGLSKINSNELCEEAVRRDQFVETHCPHIISFEYIKRNKDYRYNISKNCKLMRTTSNSVFKITYPQDWEYFQALAGQSDH